MKKFFSFLMISTALFMTAGCGKKQPKATTPVVTAVAQEESSIDKKEDYTIAA